MKTVKATFVEGTADINGKEENIYAVQFEDGSILHEQITSQISYLDYVKLINKNHPEYDFTPVEEEIIITAPKAREAVHPHKEELSKSFDVEEIVLETPSSSNVDLDTGEIKESQQEPLKTDNMNKEATPKKKVSLGRKAKWYAACGLGIGVRTITVPTHATLQTAADILQASANGVRNLEAFSIDKLNVSSSTRAEIKGRIDQRTARIESVLAMPVTLPINITKGIVSSIKAARVSVVQPQTA